MDKFSIKIAFFLSSFIFMIEAKNPEISSSIAYAS